MVENNAATEYTIVNNSYISVVSTNITDQKLIYIKRINNRGDDKVRAEVILVLSLSGALDLLYPYVL